jgi:hypothetical protein
MFSQQHWPESCAVSGNIAGEALTGVRAGWVEKNEKELAAL